MDFNIACALHLASIGKGRILVSEKFFSEDFFQEVLQETTKSCSEKEEAKVEEAPEGSKKSYDSNMITKVIEKNLDLGNLEDYYLPDTFKSSAKVLMSGLGADEVFGGYARYATASKRSMEDLQAEISLDLDRLWERNFGRDDRAISSTGKE